jgi:diguanylate cyclase (GGDEF)-like protein
MVRARARTPVRSPCVVETVLDDDTDPVARDRLARRMKPKSAMRALVIADTTYATAVIPGALRDAGYDAITRAASLAEGYAELARGSADVVVVDLSQPCSREQYRALVGRLHDVPVIAIVPLALMQTAFEAGVDDCVGRPIHRGELVARARAAIRHRIARTRTTRRQLELADAVRSLEQEKRELERTACVDPLTGLANRRHALALLAEEWKRSARDRTPLSLVLVDLDVFHEYNELYGHLGGDACLRQVTAEMARCLHRPSDVLGRWGGEEFLAVLANTEALGASLVAERLRAAVERLGIPHAASASGCVTISAGFATARPTPGESPDTLVQIADRALLAAKASGRNRTSGEAPPAPAPRPAPPDVRYPLVVVDPWLAARIPRYLAATRAELEAARTACARGLLDQVTSAARRLRANSDEHAIGEIAELAQRLGEAARERDTTAVYGVIDDVVRYIDHVQVAYHRPLDRAG